MADLVNGFFEMFGGILLAMNCRRLYVDKKLSGVSIIPTSFFMLWGYWNLYFYPHYGAWLSFVGGIFVVLSNTTWVGMAIYYRRQR